jgi:hypothetical protein
LIHLDLTVLLNIIKQQIRYNKNYQESSVWCIMFKRSVFIQVWFRRNLGIKKLVGKKDQWKKQNKEYDVWKSG